MGEDDDGPRTRVDDSETGVMICLFLSEGIDGDSTRQEQGGQRDGFHWKEHQNRWHEKTCSYRRGSRAGAGAACRLELVVMQASMKR